MLRETKNTFYSQILRLIIPYSYNMRQIGFLHVFVVCGLLLIAVCGKHIPNFAVSIRLRQVRRIINTVVCFTLHNSRRMISER